MRMVWLLDVLLIEFCDGHKLAASLKDSQQFRRAKTTGSYRAPAKVVAEAWDELRGRAARRRSIPRETAWR
jgi:hypothetical protein